MHRLFTLEESVVPIARMDLESSALAMQLNRSPDQIELVMCPDALLRAFAVNTKDAPEHEAISTHPLLRKAARKPMPFDPHVAPMFVIGDSRPGPPWFSGIEHSELARTFVEDRQQKTPCRRMINNGRKIGNAIRIHKDG